MRALVTTLDPAQPMEIRTVPDPVPAPGQAVVAVRAFSLNRGELASITRNGVGWIPGQDVAGVVIQAAADGSGPAVGTRVVALTDECGWAEQVAARTDWMAPLPDNVSFAQACTLPVAGLTALRALRLGGALLGRRVLITGAAGGVGTLAVQLAAASGAHVTAVIGRPDRAAGLRELGAHETVEGIANAQGRFWLVLESGGGDSLAEAVRHVEPRGTVVVYGSSSGQGAMISFADFRAAQHARIQSFFYYTSEPLGVFGPDLELLVSLIAGGKVRPVIGAERQWTEFNGVAEQLRNRQVAGKAVFHVE